MPSLPARALPPLLLAGCAALPHDGAPVTAQRPVVAADTGTAPDGSIEIEAGVHAGRGGIVHTPSQLKLGLDPRTEAFLEWTPYVRVDAPGPDPDGVGDVVLGARHRLREAHGGRPAAAAQTTLKLPVADEEQGLGSGEVDLGLAGILTWRREHSALTAFYQSDLLGEPGGGADLGHRLALLGSRFVAREVAVFGELAALLVPEQDDERVLASAGVTWNPTRYVVWDLALITGLSPDAPDWELALGFTQNLGRFRR